MKWKNCKDILVYIEHDNQNIKRISLEMMHEANRIALTLNQKVIAIVIGCNIKHIADECIYYGAHEVFYVDDERLKEYVTDVFVDIIKNISFELKPNIMLIGASYEGKDLAPNLAIKLNTGLTADCTELSVRTNEENEDILLMTRPTYGGNIIATIVCSKERPQMATIRPGIMEKPKKDENRIGIVREFNTSIKKSKVEILETIKEKEIDKPINEEEVLIVGGAGITSKKNYESLFVLANKLNGGVGVSRALFDKHYAKHERQVGQTGTTVKPKLYISFGVSGAIQHGNLHILK